MIDGVNRGAYKKTKEEARDRRNSAGRELAIGRTPKKTLVNLSATVK